MLIGPYLNATTFSENTCGRNCYQNYQNASHEFYKSCRPQMNATLVPLAFAISNFQEFRNQACCKFKFIFCYYSSLIFIITSAGGLTVSFLVAENPKEKNCYSLIAGLVPPSSATVTEMVDYAVQNTEEERRVLTETAAKTDAADATSVTAAAAAPLSARNKHTEATDLLDFACDYGLGYQTNLLVEAQVCMKLSTFGCCAATGITMVTQNPVGGLAAVAAGGKPDPTIFPPCLLKYLNDVCPAVDLQLYCTNGSIANTAVISGVISMPKLTVPVQLKSFPNMYDKASVLTLQGVLTTGLAQVPGFTQWPFLFNPVLPLTVQIMDYTYYGK